MKLQAVELTYESNVHSHGVCCPSDYSAYTENV